MSDRERDRAFRKERTAQLRAGLAIRKDTYAEIARLLTRAEAEIKALLAGTPSEYQEFYLSQLQPQIKATLAEVGEQSAGTLGQAASASWQAGAALVDEPLAAGGVRIAGLIPVLDTAQLLAMRAFMTDRIKDVSVQLANRVSAELGLTMIGAQSVGDTVSHIATLFENQGRSRALTIVRTELGRAYSVATHERTLQAAKVLPGLKKQWRRSGKVHSRPGHDAIDGQIREPHKKFQLPNGVELRFPRDPKAPPSETINCGCEELSYMEHWEVEHPDRKPFSELEKQLDARKGNLAYLTATGGN